MIIKEIELNADRHSRLAVNWMYNEFFAVKGHNLKAPDSYSEVLKQNNLIYGLECSAELLAVGAIRRQFLKYGVAHFTNIVVAEHMRSQGYGAELVSGLENEALNLGCDMVELRPLRGIDGFYTKLGYRQTEEDRRLFVKDLV